MTAKSEVSDSLDKLSPFELYPYASYWQNRKGGGYKRHKTLAHAKSAIAVGKMSRHSSNNGRLYRWEGVVGEDGRWLEIHNP